jgi:hypothetical protein
LDLFITAELYKDASAAFLSARTDVQDVMAAALAASESGRGEMVFDCHHRAR